MVSAPIKFYCRAIAMRALVRVDVVVGVLGIITEVDLHQFTGVPLNFARVGVVD